MTDLRAGTTAEGALAISAWNEQVGAVDASSHTTQAPKNQRARLAPSPSTPHLAHPG